jgi:hypothetical protein
VGPEACQLPGTGGALRDVMTGPSLKNREDYNDPTPIPSTQEMWELGPVA